MWKTQFVTFVSSQCSIDVVTEENPVPHRTFPVPGVSRLSHMVSNRSSHQSFAT